MTPRQVGILLRVIVVAVALFFVWLVGRAA